MKLFYSGFCLQGEKELFKEYSIENEFTISGFSYGAKKALEYVLSSKKRVDLLQFFSPAFFLDKDEKYKRMQMMFFKKDGQTYTKKFLKSCGLDEAQQAKYFKLGSDEELKELLYYDWDKRKLQVLKDRNIRLEVYLGAEDKIIDANKAKDFFKEFGDVYYIKNKGHIL